MFYSQSAVCILHSVCSLQSAVCVLHWPISGNFTLKLGDIHMTLEWLSFWYIFIPSPYIFSAFVYTIPEQVLLFTYNSFQNEFTAVISLNKILTVVWNFILVSCKLKTYFHIENHKPRQSGLSGACVITNRIVWGKWSMCFWSGVKTTQTREQNNFQRVSGHNDQPNPF